MCRLCSRACVSSTSSPADAGVRHYINVLLNIIRSSLAIFYLSSYLSPHYVIFIMYATELLMFFRILAKLGLLGLHYIRNPILALTMAESRDVFVSSRFNVIDVNIVSPIILVKYGTKYRTYIE